MSSNAFRRFLEAGYTRLIPITPVNAEVSERSSLFKRRGALGKAPGVRGPDGLWRGVDWLKLEPALADLDAWHEMGAGVGIRTGDRLIAIDIDTLDKDLADKCGTTATEILGASENRVGRSPKRAKLYRVSEPVAYRRIKFDGGHVELLSEGKQIVVHGLHPVTGRNYEWPRGLPRYDRLPLVTAQQISDYFAKLADVLPAAKVEVESLPAERANVAQDALRGSLDDIKRAVASLPNTSAIAPSYDDYVRVGYAIKGATQDDPEAGLELFQEWSAKWTDGHNDPGVVAADWRRMKPPYSVGAQYLYHLAQQHGGFSTAETWFEAAPAAPVELNVLKPIGDDEWQTAKASRPCIVEDWFYEDVGHLAAPGGVGKTTLLLFQAIHIVLGRDLFGHKIRRRGPVVYLTAEDDRGTMVARLRQMCTELGLTPQDVAKVRSSIFILDVSGRGFKLTRVSGEVVVPSDGASALVDHLQAVKPSMLFVDPAVSFGVGESRVNDAEQGLIDAARLIRNDVGCGVLYVHHTGQQVARDKTIDQYAGRGGSALADGSRMVHVMQSLTAEEWHKATGDILQADESGAVYARPKITWAPPTRPQVYLKRKGYLFTRHAALSESDGVRLQQDRHAEIVLQHIVRAIASGRTCSRKSLDLDDAIPVPRRALRLAIQHLVDTDRLVEEPGAAANGRGGPKPTLLWPVGNVFS